MKTKPCFKCSKVLPLNEFYRHKKMSDGHLGKCKSCTKKDSLKTRSGNPEHYKAYDRMRSNLPHRKRLRKIVADRWRKDPKLRKRMNAMKLAYLKRNKVKRAAHLLVQYAIRANRLIRKPCEICGKKKVDAHHDDYSEPLKVRWLCRKHHTEHHKEERERLRNI